jgi:hypothetical protein
MKRLRAISRVSLWLLAAGMMVGSVFAWAQSPPQIQGTVIQLTDSVNGQFNPAISGNIVCYTGLQTGEPNIYYVNVTAPFVETAVTTDVLAYDELCDVSGSTIVYTRYTAPGSDVWGFTIGGTGTNPFDISNDASEDAASPGVSPPVTGAGQIVAWEQANSTGNNDIWAEDLAASTPTLVEITNNGGSGSSNSPNVWGRNIAYSTQTATGCQVYVTNFDTLATTQLTNTTGCNQSTDISANYVVYQSNRACNSLSCSSVFVHNLTTNIETQIPVAGYEQNPHISGNWVSFENVVSSASGQTSSIYLYNIASGNAYAAVSGTSPTNSAFLSDIDGYQVAYTGGNPAEPSAQHIYVFQFTPEIPFASLSAVPVLSPKQGAFAVAGEFTLASGGTVNLSSNYVTLQLGGFSTTIPPGSFQLDKFGVYVYEGTINGVNLIAAIEPLSTTQFAYGISGDGAAGLPTANPITVGLTVGDNNGTVSVKGVIL